MGGRGRQRGAPWARLLAALTLAAALVASAGGLSNATFLASSANRGTEIAGAADWVAPSVALVDPGGAIHGTVTLAVNAADTYGSGVASVRIERSGAGANAWTTVCNDASPPYSCPLDTTALANDYYDLRALATDNAGYTNTDTVLDVQVDNRVPTVTMADPGSPLAGVATLSADAADADSGVAAVTIQRSPLGKATWTEVCTVSSAPYSCRFDTRAVAEGLYDFRALATDVAGNVGVSALVQGRRIDNTINSISLEDPGAYLGGTVTLLANASSTVGVTAVSIQRSPAGKGSWTEICRLTGVPFSCPWNTREVADGGYDLRAVMTTGSGAALASATIAGRQVDNTPVRGLDVQAANRSGGVAGRLESGDSLVLTYSEQMSPGSIVSGWSGAAPAPVFLRLRDGNLLGAGSAGDTVQLSTDAAGNSPIRLGSVNLRGDFVKNNKTSVFNATLTASVQAGPGGGLSVLTVTVGSLVSGGALRTSTALAQMVWTPSSGATDLSANPCSTAPITEIGPLDRDL